MGGSLLDYNVMTNSQHQEERTHEVEMIESLIAMLAEAPAGLDRYDTFDELCAYALGSVEGGPSLNLTEQMTDSVRDHLLAAPGAAALLRLLLVAMERFRERWHSAGGADKVQTTAGSREALAHAFFLLGKQGGRGRSLNQRWAIGERFSCEYLQILKRDEARGPITELNHKRARSRALEEVFRLIHREPYLRDDDTHNSRMDALRALLREVGSWPTQGDEK